MKSQNLFRYPLFLSRIFIWTLVFLVSIPVIQANAMNHVGRIIKKNPRCIKKGIQHLLKKPYLEIPGNEVPCQKKAIVNAWLCHTLKKDESNLDLGQLAFMVSLVQPKNRQSHVTQKSVREQVYDIAEQEISLKEADNLLKEIKPLLNQEFQKQWCEIAKSFEQEKAVPQSDTDIIFDFLKKHDLPIVAAIYVGSPTLDEVMQHQFQYNIYMHFDDAKKRYYADPDFDARGRACGKAPVAFKPAVVFHMGIPNCFYNQLSTKKFLQSFPHIKSAGHTALAKLNLPNIDPKELMAYSFMLMNLKDHDLQEPGLPLGSFRFPISLYHFSFSPCWPDGGHKDFLGQPLWPHNFIEFKMSAHRETYAGDYSPLEIYPVFPNPLLGDFAAIPGFEFRLKKKGFQIILRLVASVKTLYPAQDYTEELAKDLNTHNESMALWDWDFEKSQLKVLQAQGKEINSIELNEHSAQKYFNEITNALKVHVEKNFCFKTRFLLAHAGITEDSFKKDGVLFEKNAYRFYKNSKR